MGLQVGKSLDSVLKRNLVALYLLQGSKYVLPLIVLGYLARVLGSDVYGFRAYVLSVMYIFQVIADFGFETSATEDVVKRGKTPEDLTFISSAVLYSRLLLLAILAVGLAGAVALIPLLQRDVLFVAVSYLTVVFNTIVPNFVFYGKEDMKIFTIRYVATKVVYIVLLVVFVRSDEDLMLVASFDLFTSIFAFAWTYIAAHAKYKVGLTLVPFKDIWDALTKSAYYFVSRAAQTLYTSFTTFVIGIAIADTTQIAWWSLSTTIVSAVQQLFTPINNVLYPRIIATRDLSLVKKFSILGGSLSLVFTVGCFVFAPLLMRIAGGEEYVEGAPVLAALSVIIFIGYFGVLYGWPTLGALGKIKELTFSTSAAAIWHIAILGIMWLLGGMTIMGVCYLRISTEIVLAGLRGYETWKLDRELKLEKAAGGEAAELAAEAQAEAETQAAAEAEAVAEALAEEAGI